MNLGLLCFVGTIVLTVVSALKKRFLRGLLFSLCGLAIVIFFAALGDQEGVNFQEKRVSIAIGQGIWAIILGIGFL